MRILLVDDDPDFRALLTGQSPAGIDFIACSGSAEAVQLLSVEGAPGVDMAIIDVNMSAFLGQVASREGFALAEWMCVHGLHTPVILVSVDRLSRPGACAWRCIGFVRKPPNLRRLYEFLHAYHDLFAEPSR